MSQATPSATSWNYADVWEAIADALGGETALVQGARRIGWAETDRRADGIASWLLGHDLGHQDKVALYLANCPEYMEAMFATLKVAGVPVNTNYRYQDDELVYLLDDADAKFVVFHGAFTERAARVRERLRQVTGWLHVDDGTSACPPWATRYEEAASSSSERVRAPWTRGPDDLVLVYTGGTTGMPKGVMWRQDDLFARVNAWGFRPYPAEAGISGVTGTLRANGKGMIFCAASPLMHGTGELIAMECMSEAGTLVLLEGRHFDAEQLLDTIDREGVNGLIWVGDAFARPVLDALDADPGRWKLESLVGTLSSGAMWSEEVKEGLLRHRPALGLYDILSSSEAIGLARSASTTTAHFTLGDDATVLSDDGRAVEPGSGQVGLVAVAGRNPLGYYKDEQKSADTFKTFEGVRYSVPGDCATVNEDGTIHLLGRGSQCINTGGEKVYPEEVEEVLKTHPAVRDAAVVGVTDARYGQVVVAFVEPSALESSAGEPSAGEPGAAPFDAETLAAHVKDRLAEFKVPRRIFVVDTVGRLANGKLDYPSLERSAAGRLHANERT